MEATTKTTPQSFTPKTDETGPLAVPTFTQKVTGSIKKTGQAAKAKTSEQVARAAPLHRQSLTEEFDNGRAKSRRVMAEATGAARGVVNTAAGWLSGGVAGIAEGLGRGLSEVDTELLRIDGTDMQPLGTWDTAVMTDAGPVIKATLDGEEEPRIFPLKSANKRNLEINGEKRRYVVIECEEGLMLAEDEYAPEEKRSSKRGMFFHSY